MALDSTSGHRPPLPPADCCPVPAALDHRRDRRGTVHKNLSGKELEWTPGRHCMTGHAATLTAGGDPVARPQPPSAAELSWTQVRSESRSLLWVIPTAAVRRARGAWAQAQSWASSTGHWTEVSGAGPTQPSLAGSTGPEHHLFAAQLQLGQQHAAGGRAGGAKLVWTFARCGGSGAPIRDTSCCGRPLTGVAYLLFGPRRVEKSHSPFRNWGRVEVRLIDIIGETASRGPAASIHSLPMRVRS